MQAEERDQRCVEAGDAANSTSPQSLVEGRWFIHVGEKTYGPYSGHEIERLATDGQITAADLLRPEGGSTWVEAKNEPTLGQLFRPGTLPHSSFTSSSAPAKSVAKWKQKKSVYSAFFQRADQESIHEDLREFFGPRADKYLAIYGKMQSSGKPYAQSWNWIVFFTTFPWFFYRKMYIWGVLSIFLPLLLGYLFGLKGNAGLAAGMSVMANSQYVLSGLRRIQKADTLGLSSDERREYLRRAGGVSTIAGILSSILGAAMLAVMILGVYLRHKSSR